MLTMPMTMHSPRLSSCMEPGVGNALPVSTEVAACWSASLAVTAAPAEQAFLSMIDSNIASRRKMTVLDLVSGASRESRVRRQPRAAAQSQFNWSPSALMAVAKAVVKARAPPPPPLARARAASTLTPRRAGVDVRAGGARERVCREHVDCHARLEVAPRIGAAAAAPAADLTLALVGSQNGLTSEHCNAM